MRMVNMDCYGDKENRRLNIDKIFSSDPVTCFEGVVELKNCVIGSNKSKGLVIKLGAAQRLYQVLLDKSSSEQLLIEAAVTVGSLARGSEQHVQHLINEGLINVMLQGLASPNPKLMEACLRCLRTVFSRKEAPIDVLYTEASLIPHLVQMAKERSPSVQECVMTMLHCGCQTPEHQDILCENGVLDLLAPLLCCNIYRVQIPSLKCLAQMCYQNEKVSELAASSSYEGKSVPDILVTLMSRDKTTEMQLASAKCMTYMFRSGAFTADDPRIVYKALPTLVRMCQKDVAPEERVDGAETLAYLTEVDTELQRIASISDHLIPTLSELLKFRPPNQNGTEPMDEDNIKNDYSKASQEVKMAQEMKQAAFKAFASLAANDEEIRKKIIDTDTLMENVVSAFSDPSPRVRLAAVRCLHSLSRSVQQLRTTFQDHAVWRPLMKLLHNADDDILTVASSTLCNLLLEFSPSKEPILECGAVELLCGLTRRDDPSLRLNGVWALMNMAFQADHKIKAQILTALGSEHVFRLLSDSDVDVLMKTLGLLRNLLSTKPVSGDHIDHIMGLHGKQVMQAIVLILEGDHNAEVKEQALCILANIADGDFAKNFIMSNEDVLKKLTTYMMHSNVKLQIAATFCISNLVWKEEEGALERQAKLKDLGVQQLLQQLLSTSDTTLFDRVKTALHQFPSQGT